MTATMHEPSTAGPAREGIADRLLVPAFWGAVSIVAMWLAVLFDGIFGPVARRVRASDANQPRLAQAERHGARAA